MFHIHWHLWILKGFFKYGTKFSLRNNSISIFCLLFLAPSHRYSFNGLKTATFVALTIFISRPLTPKTFPLFRQKQNPVSYRLSMRLGSSKMSLTSNLIKKDYISLNHDLIYTYVTWALYFSRDSAFSKNKRGCRSIKPERRFHFLVSSNTCFLSENRNWVNFQSNQTI